MAPPPLRPVGLALDFQPVYSRPPSRATGRGIYTLSGVCCGFSQAFRGPVCNPLCGITSQLVSSLPQCAVSLSQNIRGLTLSR